MTGAWLADGVAGVDDVTGVDAVDEACGVVSVGTEADGWPAACDVQAESTLASTTSGAAQTFLTFSTLAAAESGTGRHPAFDGFAGQGARVRFWNHVDRGT